LPEYRYSEFRCANCDHYLTKSIGIVVFILSKREPRGVKLMIDVRESRRIGQFPGSVRGLTLIWAIACCLLPGRVHGQIAVRDQGFLPFRDEPINYLSDRVNDPIAKLQERIDQGKVRLRFEPDHGYLKSVMDLLDVPVASQTLVFSKTSFQYKRISPASPRALYFNDNVYIGWIQNGHSLEIASFDPDQGAIFYLLDQQPSEEPVFVRATLDCTQCHVAPGTRGVPGVLLRSIFARPTGTQAVDTDSFVTGHESPLRERWGGWYVTGRHGRQNHMGNVFGQDPEHPQQLDRVAGANVSDLSKRFSTAAYLSGHSDIVAHLVLAHQTQMHNLITVANYKTRLALYAEKGAHQSNDKAAGAISEATRRKIEGASEELLRYLLFADETPLDDPIVGSSSFARDFAARGPRDPKGRSLRDFDLRRRVFKYPCSYLIYSEALDALPKPAKDIVYRRLLEVLTGHDQSPEYAKFSAADRRAILEILLATKPNLPSDWRRLATASLR
jgi:hypothetical protein